MNTQTDIDKIKKRIDTMLKKAASTEHEAEREAFQAKAISLMTQWELTERDIATEDPIKVHRMNFKHMGNMAFGAASLALYIAIMNGGYGYFHEGIRKKGERKGTYIDIYATDRVMDRVNILLAHLLRQMEYECIMSHVSSRQAFCIGWANKVADRLQKALEASYSTSNALVPTNSEAKRKAHSEVNIGGPMPMKVNDNDYVQGIRAGDKADLGQQRIK